MQMFLSSRQVFSTQQALSRVQESGRLAMEFISEDIRMAGFMGCLTRESEIQNDLNDSEDSFWADFTTSKRLAKGVRGYAAGDGSLPTLVPTPMSSTDVLVVRYASGLPSVVVDPPLPEGAETPVVVAGELHVAGSAGQLGAVGSSLLVSNCVAARIFNSTGVSVDGTRTKISHGGSWPGAIVNRFSNFYPGAEVSAVSTVVYYIGANPDGRPSLYRREGAGQSQELIDGIENMVLRFRLDGELKSLSELAALTEDAWDRVDSVRVDFLVQSNETNVLESPQAYSLAGVNVAGPADRRMRQVFGSTVAMRSRVN